MEYWDGTSRWVYDVALVVAICVVVITLLVLISEQHGRDRTPTDRYRALKWQYELLENRVRDLERTINEMPARRWITPWRDRA